MQSVNKKLKQRIHERDLATIPKLLAKAQYKTAERRAVAKLIRDNLSIAESLEWCRYLSMREENASRELACAIVGVCYPTFEEETFELLMCLADDPCWGVKEEVTWAYAEILERDFEGIYPVFQEWTQHSSENIRRAIVIAAKRVGKSRKEEFAHPLFQLLEPLLSDRSVYVRKNLGPFALGDGLLRYYPKQGFWFLWKWMETNDEQIRWNIAMSLSSTAGAQYADQAIEILSELALDNRRYIWRAVASAMRELVRRRPSVTLPVLRGWLEDKRRQHIAKIVARYVDIISNS